MENRKKCYSKSLLTNNASKSLGFFAFITFDFNERFRENKYKFIDNFSFVKYYKTELSRLCRLFANKLGE